MNRLLLSCVNGVQPAKFAHKFAPKSRKTGRICGNCVLPRQSWRYDAAFGKYFQKTLGKRIGYDTGLEERMLLSSMGQRHRRLDEKKMRQLTNIMSIRIEEAAGANQEIAKHAVQFSKVKVNTSFTEVTVFWLCTGTSDEEVGQILDKERHTLRKSLSDVLGSNCPEIRFVPDKTNILIEEMNRLFKEADYGADYRTMGKTASILGNVDDSLNIKADDPNPPWKKAK